MKKYLLVVTITLLTIALLSVNTGRVYAFPARPETPAPVVTPLTGDADFTTAVVAESNLPGSSSADDGMILPVGYTAGDKQFSGDGIEIKGLDLGTAEVCFSFKGASEGWSAQVARWSGSDWGILPSTTSKDAESPYASVCANVSQSGTYAALLSYKPPADAPQKPKVCSFGYSTWVLTNWPAPDEIQLEEFYLMSDLSAAAYPTGTYFHYKVINHNPNQTLSGALDGYLQVVWVTGDDNSSTYYIMFPEDTPVFFAGGGAPYITVRVFIDDCYVDFIYRLS